MMRHIDHPTAPIRVRASPVMDAEEQLDDLLAAMDQHVHGRIATAVESACSRIVASGGAPLLGDEADPPLGRLQRTLAQRFDLGALDAAIDAIVESRVKALYDVATASREVPVAGIDISVLPTMTEEEALRDARSPLDDAGLRSLGSSVDIDEDAS